MVANTTIKIERAGENQFQVTVTDGAGQTHHSVSLSREDYRRLCEEKITEETLIEGAFSFLLDREPKESILQRFDLMVVGRYFPEFERELPRYLKTAR